MPRSWIIIITFMDKRNPLHNNRSSYIIIWNGKSVELWIIILFVFRSSLTWIMDVIIIKFGPFWILNKKANFWTSVNFFRYFEISTTQPCVSHHLEQRHKLKLWSQRTWTLTYVTTPTYCPLLLQHQFFVNYWNIVYYCNTVSKDIRFSTCKRFPGSSMKTGLPMFVPGLFR